MRFSSRETVAMLRQRYPAGTRVALEEMSDPCTRLRPGDQGTVLYVDDAGGIGIAWDNGEGLSAIWGVDRIRIIEDDKT
jgi:7-keto-8-aminopelargonate synthetase-like enzyme